MSAGAPPTEATTPGDVPGPPRDARYRLSRHAALKTRADGDVLVLPEQAIRLGGSGGEILRLCGEGRTVDELVAALGARYPDAEGLDAEVARFLAEMRALGGVVTLAPTQGTQAASTAPAAPPSRGEPNR